MRLDIAEVRRAVVVAAHPDDESLGAGGLLARLADARVPITVIVVTDGGASHPLVDEPGRAELVRRRAEELHEAVAVLAPEARIEWLGIADGAARENRDRIAADLRAVVGSEPIGTLLVAPWSGDGHRDHRVVGEVCEEIATASGIRLVAYPIWFWHWGDPDAGLGSFERMESLELTSSERERKVAAIGAYRSQSAEGSGAAPVLRADVLSHFRRDVESFILPVGGDARTRHFERLHRHDADPWSVATSWYERRKRAILLASLPDARYGSVLELGASAGHLTIELADRADAVVAVDLSPSAVESNRRRTAERPGVRVEVGDVREGLPAGRFDLVVLSEIGYYLSPDELRSVLASIAASLADGGALVACHWRGRADDMAQSGDDVHAAVGTAFDVRVVHDEPEFAIVVAGPRR